MKNKNLIYAFIVVLLLLTIFLIIKKEHERNISANSNPPLKLPLQGELTEYQKKLFTDSSRIEQTKYDKTRQRFARSEDVRKLNAKIVEKINNEDLASKLTPLLDKHKITSDVLHQIIEVYKEMDEALLEAARVKALNRPSEVGDYNDSSKLEIHERNYKEITKKITEDASKKLSSLVEDDKLVKTITNIRYKYLMVKSGMAVD